MVAWIKKAQEVADTNPNNIHGELIHGVTSIGGIGVQYDEVATEQIGVSLANGKLITMGDVVEALLLWGIGAKSANIDYTANEIPTLTMTFDGWAPGGKHKEAYIMLSALVQAFAKGK